MCLIYSNQGRIQNFEMGGEFCNNVREIKYYFNIWRIRKRKKEGDSEKGGWKFTHFTSPGSVPANLDMFLKFTSFHSQQDSTGVEQIAQLHVCSIGRITQVFQGS